jgi:hypothetical protein
LYFDSLTVVVSLVLEYDVASYIQKTSSYRRHEVNVLIIQMLLTQTSYIQAQADFSLW